MNQILALLVTLGVTSAYPFNDYSINPTCPDELKSSNCSCTFSISDYELQCPAANPQIIIRYKKDNYVNIECMNSSYEDYLAIPIIKMSTTKVQVRRCPLPRNLSFKKIFDRIGINNTRELFFQSYGIDVANSLLREHFKGLENLQRLTMSGNKIAELPSDVFDDLVQLTWLDLRSNRVHLSHNIFDKLVELRVLELGFNGIEKFEEGIFKNLKNLQHLNIWGNGLKAIPKNLFDGLTSLTDMDISQNPIENLEPEVFSQLPKLRNLNMNKNSFSQLPANLFEKNPELSVIKILENQQPLKTLPEGLFKNLPGLTEVRIKCDLENLPQDLFNGSSNLINLLLAGNKLQGVPGELLSNQRMLRILDLSANRLQNLDEKLLRDAVSLSMLKLSYNNISDVPEKFFENTNSLKEIYMDNNNLKKLSENLFKQDIEIMNLQNNQLTFNDYYLPPELNPRPCESSPFNQMINLRVLNLRNNKLRCVFSDWIINNMRLEELDVSYNEITELTTEDLMFTRKLMSVNLSHNKIQSIKVGDIYSRFLSNDKDFQININIDLNENPINCNCELLSFAEYLKDANNKVYSGFRILTDSLKCASPVQLIDIPVKEVNSKALTCPIESIDERGQKFCPSKCECLKRPSDRMVEIDCSGRMLTEVPRLFNLTHVEFRSLESIELDISNNSIKELPKIGQVGYDYVSEIYAQNNEINSLLVENLPAKLKILDLSGNQIEKADNEVISRLNSSILQKFMLADNPIDCSCPSFDFITFLQSILSKTGSIKCANSTREIEKLSRVKVCDDSSQLTIILSVTIAILGFLVAILSLLYYRYNLEIKVWLFSHNMLLWLITEEELDKDKIYDAFISYSHKDEEFITENLVPMLEKTMAFKTCWHERDWTPGELILVQISKSVDESKRTIVVLSKSFLDSVWGRMEFRQAHLNSIKENRSRVIVILYEDIGNIDELDEELKAYLKTTTYIKWGDAWFWDKLRYAMPHPPTVKGMKKGLIKNHIKSSVDDKLELIKPVPVTPPALTTPPAEINSSPFTISKEINQNGMYINGYSNGAFIINTNAKQSDV